MKRVNFRHDLSTCKRTIADYTFGLWMRNYWHQKEFILLYSKYMYDCRAHCPIGCCTHDCIGMFYLTCICTWCTQQCTCTKMFLDCVAEHGKKIVGYALEFIIWSNGQLYLRSWLQYIHVSTMNCNCTNRTDHVSHNMITLGVSLRLLSLRTEIHVRRNGVHVQLDT